MLFPGWIYYCISSVLGLNMEFNSGSPSEMDFFFNGGIRCEEESDLLLLVSSINLVIYHG